LNLDMPLIRYRVGDQGALPEVDVPCACGRTLPYLERIEGRADDTLYSVDGRRIGRLDPVFKSQLPIREAQIIQETLTRIRVRYVPAPGFTPETGKLITERLQERLGRIEVILERVNEIPRTANGKFRAVISQLSLEERRQVQAADE
jgi:phenylacetate-CoA ligase